MHNDGPDTIAIEDSHWMNTELDDVFLPSVRVQLRWKDLEAAVERGAVVPQQAHALWASWASPLSGLRVGADTADVAPALAPTQAKDARHDAPAPPPPGVLQRLGLPLGLLAGVVLGAGGVWLALGG